MLPSRRCVMRLARVLAVGFVPLIAAGCGSPSDRSLVDPACALQEEREGTPYLKWEGSPLADVRELAARQGLSVVVRYDEDSDAPPGTVVRTSVCGAPEKAFIAVVSR